MISRNLDDCFADIMMELEKLGSCRRASFLSIASVYRTPSPIKPLVNRWSDLTSKFSKFTFQRNWRVCGVVPSVSPYSSNTISLSKPSKLLENEADHELFDSSRTGYPCGLWMLFHYLTVASQHNSANGDSNVPGISATDVMSFIRLTVERLFNCRICRSDYFPRIFW